MCTLLYYSAMDIMRYDFIEIQYKYVNYNDLKHLPVVNISFLFFISEHSYWSQFKFQDERVCDDQTAQNQHQRPVSAEDRIIYLPIYYKSVSEENNHRI